MLLPLSGLMLFCLAAWLSRKVHASAVWTLPRGAGGDGLSDGWEVRNGFSPLSAVGTDGAEGDDAGLYQIVPVDLTQFDEAVNR